MRHAYHDTLALNGVGSAHPGGYSATLAMFRRLDVPRGSSVLDVGCGTGRTACYLAETFGYKVVGLDAHPLMIEKAGKRAEMVEEARRRVDAGKTLPADVDGKARKQTDEGRLGVEFVCGDALAMPFADDTFDFVVVESVSVFLPIEKALQEYRRVVRPGGVIVNLEMRRRGDIPVEDVRPLYGIEYIPTQQEWKRHYEKAGFNQVDVVLSKPLDLIEIMTDESKHPDRAALRSDDITKNAFEADITQRNALFLLRHHGSLGYCAVRAVK